MKVPTPNAAMVNAMMGHGIELDDAHGSGLIKAGSVLVPAAFAVAELSGASGKQVVAGIVAGYDIAIRIAKAINPGHRRPRHERQAAWLQYRADRMVHWTCLHAIRGHSVVSRRSLHGEALQSGQIGLQRGAGGDPGEPRLQWSEESARIA